MEGSRRSGGAVVGASKKVGSGGPLLAAGREPFTRGIINDSYVEQKRKIYNGRGKRSTYRRGLPFRAQQQVLLFGFPRLFW